LNEVHQLFAYESTTRKEDMIKEGGKQRVDQQIARYSSQ